MWGLLAWVRREFFNDSPTITYNPTQNTQSLNLDGDRVITGNIGAVDADGDALTYTVIGRPLNGGTVSVDANGNFTYRPMNAMAAVGGVDTFLVVVNEEAEGVHVHGPLGLLQFVPILGNFFNPGGGHRVAQAITVNVTPVAGVDLSFRRRLPLGRRARRIPGRGWPRLTGGSQFRLVQVGARPDQSAAENHQRRAGERAGHLHLLRQRRAAGPQRSRHEHLPDERGVEPHLPEFHCIG